MANGSNFSKKHSRQFDETKLKIKFILANGKENNRNNNNRSDHVQSSNYNKNPFVKRLNGVAHKDDGKVDNANNHRTTNGDCKSEANERHIALESRRCVEKYFR